MRNILIVYCYVQYPPRIAIIDHLYSFRRYSGERCFYLNLAVQAVPRYLLKIPFDLIVFHTIFLSTRWHLPTFERALERARLLKNISTVKVALLQDEFIQMDVICDFINEFGVQHVFSVAPPSEWHKIYRTVDFDKVKFSPVLTGYLDDRTILRITRLSKKISERDIDIGYRSRRVEPWSGRHGLLKSEIATLFAKTAPRRGLRVDISTRTEDVLFGYNWYQFLLRCKYTIGVEGGASILDWDGKIRQKTIKFLAEHPDAELGEVENANFLGLDGSLGLFAISPRHLEACVTRTCQILVEGEYNGILTAGKHYIELKRDFSNLKQILDVVSNDSRRRELVENAYQDVVDSRRYTYPSFVTFVMEKALKDKLPQTAGHASERVTWFWWRWNCMNDILNWQKIKFLQRTHCMRERLVAALPNSIRALMHRWIRRWRGASTREI